MLGLLYFAISWTSRIPFILKAVSNFSEHLLSCWDCLFKKKRFLSHYLLNICSDISFFFLNCTLQNRGEMSDSSNVSSRGFLALAGAFYASAVLLYDPQLEAVVKALPWILSGACCAVLDVSVSFSCSTYCGDQN